MIEKYSSILKDVVLLARGDPLGKALGYHFADIVVAELSQVVESTESEPEHEAVFAVIDPFIQSMALSKDKILVKRISTEIFDECARLICSEKPGAFSTLDATQISKLLFDLGACKIRHRRVKALLCLRCFPCFVCISTYLCIVSPGQSHKAVVLCAVLIAACCCEHVET